MTGFHVKVLIVIGALAFAPLAVAALAQEPAEEADRPRQDEPIEQSQSTGDVRGPQSPDRADQPEPARPGGSEQDERRSRYYLGRRPDQPDDSQTERLPGRPAEDEPTPLLPGPFVPEGEFPLDALDAPAETQTETQAGRTADRRDADTADDQSAEQVPAPGEDKADAGRQDGDALLTEPLDRPGTGPADQATAGASDQDAALSRTPFEVITDPLESLDPAGVGLSEVPGGALPVDFWNGTPRGRVAEILSILPLPAASARQTQLALQLLLSPANLSVSQGDGLSGPPDEPGVEQDSERDSEPGGELDGERGADDADPDDGATATILEARLGLLHSGGQSRALLDLYEVIPEAVRTPPMRRLAADALLANGRYRDVCRLAGDAVMDDDSPYWLRVQALCEAIGGNRSAAYFQIDLLEETQSVGSSFLELIERVLAQTEESTILPLGDVDRLDPVTFAATQLTQVSFPTELAANAPPILMGPIAMAGPLPAEVRLPAAREAARLALIDGDVLGNLFSDLNFREDEREAAMSMAENDPSFRTDALLYRMAAEETDDPASRARWIIAAFDRARSAGTVRIVAEVLAGPTGAITPNPELAFFADTAGRIHLLAGEHDKAEDWYEMVRGLASGANADATKALVDLWPLMVILDTERRLPYSERILDLWWQGRAILPPDERKRRAALFYGLLEAFGFSVPEPKWQAVLTAPRFDGASPPLSQWRRMIQAGRADRLGETAALALAALGAGGPGAANPSALSAAVYHLDALGLGATARRLALEALIARGF